MNFRVSTILNRAGGGWGEGRAERCGRSATAALELRRGIVKSYGKPNEIYSIEGDRTKQEL